MSQRKKRILKVKRRFEPTRLSAIYLKQAYEQLVPSSICIIAQSEPESASNEPKLLPNEEMRA
jgi:hypothetical protein